MSDEGGKYRFINFKPGRYLVRCDTVGGYTYYGTEGVKGKQGGMEISGVGESRIRNGETLQVARGKPLKNIDFRFSPFKKGNWKSYTYLDGLVSNPVLAIHQNPDGVMWFGTPSGVSQYDGTTFTNFTQKDGLPQKPLLSFWRTSNGEMWVGTQGRSAFCYNGERFVGLPQ